LTGNLAGEKSHAWGRYCRQVRVNVNAIAPGFIQSDMTHVLPEEVSQKFLSQIPMNTYGMPTDMANVVLFLVSENEVRENMGG
jgi:NAD(P)-dependent dehydrogenase (short-subunit alcohol dehydrogenase family)